MIARIEIDGIAVPPVIKEQLELAILASFEDDETQANISADSFTFILQRGYEILQGFIDQGRIFEDLPIKIVLEDQGLSEQTFAGFVRLFKEHTIDPERQQIEATIEKGTGLNRFFDRASGLTFDLLYEKGVITDSDFTEVEYTVEEITNFLDLLILSVQTYSILVSLVENAYKIADAVATISGILSAGVTGSFGSLAYTLIQAFAYITYQLALIVQLVRIANQVLRVYGRPKRIAKAGRFDMLMRKACEYLGLKFEHGIERLNYYTYLPRNTEYDILDRDGFIGQPKGPSRGIPNAGDNESIVLEFFNLVRNIFNAKIAIKGDTVQLHPRNSTYWRRQSSYVMPDLIDQPFSYNTDEARAINSISFAYDSSDEFTIKDNRDYSVIAYLENAGPNNNIQGREATNIPLALGSRKDSLSAFEKALSAFFTPLDDAIRTLGGRGNFASKYRAKVGVLRVTTNNWTTPKLLWVDPNGRLPEDHRNRLSARVLWDKYHSERSFVTNAERRQRLKYEGVNIPFSLKDFQKITDNSYFRDSKGRLGKIERIEWNMNSDSATVDYYIEEQYTDRLTETITYPR